MEKAGIFKSVFFLIGSGELDSTKFDLFTWLKLAPMYVELICDTVEDDFYL